MPQLEETKETWKLMKLEDSGLDLRPDKKKINRKIGEIWIRSVDWSVVIYQH